MRKRFFGGSRMCMTALAVCMLTACNSRPTYDVRVMQLSSNCAGNVQATLVHDPDPEVKTLAVDAQSGVQREAQTICVLASEGYDLVVGFVSGVTCRFAYGEPGGLCYDTESGLPVLCVARLETTGWRWPSQGPGYTVPRALETDAVWHPWAIRRYPLNVSTERHRPILACQRNAVLTESTFHLL